MAAKGKFSPKVVAVAAHLIELGATHRRVCDAVGVTETTFYEWMNTKPSFSEAIKAAEAACLERNLAVIKAAATDGTWQAAAWMLERRYPQEYGKTVQEHQGQQKILVEYVSDWRTAGGDAS